MIRRPAHRSAAAALAARLVVGSLLVLLGCAGGSGSSGFDLAENGAIMQALDEERCVESDGLTICPANGPEPTVTATPAVDPTSPTATSTSGEADTPTPTPPGEDTLTPTPTSPFNNPDVTVTPTEEDETPTPTGPHGDMTPTATPTQPARSRTPTRTPSRTPTPTIFVPMEMRIDTSLGENRAVDCAPNAGVCSFSFAFAPQGFAPDTAFHVAARLRDPDGEWLIFPAEEVSSNPIMPVFEALVVLPLDGRGEDEFVAQVAVLVFLTPTDAQPPAVDSLGASGANFAFVTSELVVVVSR